MKRVDFCRLALQSGMDADPRGRAALEREPRESTVILDDLRPEKKAVSDLEPFPNPYTDSRILHSRPEQNVNTVFAGIDIETPELSLASRLNGMGAVRAHRLSTVGSRSLLLFSAACPG